jgi:hypothetical protein
VTIYVRSQQNLRPQHGSERATVPLGCQHEPIIRKSESQLRINVRRLRYTSAQMHDAPPSTGGWSLQMEIKP